MPSGIDFRGSAFPVRMSARRAGDDRLADLEPVRREDVALLAVRVVDQRDAGRPVRVVLDRGDLAGDAESCRA